MSNPRTLPEPVDAILSELRISFVGRPYSDPILRAFNRLCNRLTAWLSGQQTDVMRAANELADLMHPVATMTELAAKVRTIPTELSA